MLEFLKSGRLGELEWGLPMERVKQLLGPPNAYETGLTAKIWVYGSLELMCYRDQLEGISLHYRRLGRRIKLRLPAALQLDEQGVSASITHDAFLALLHREGIPFVETSFGVDDLIRVSSGRAPSAVESWFGSHNGQLRLVSFLREIS